MSKCKYTSIGGQALIEGIMMKSPEKTAMAVRTKTGEIDISYPAEINLRKKYKVLRIPVIRGVIGFAESLINGYKALMLSAEKSGFTDLEDEEPKQETKDPESKETENASLEEKKPGLLINVVMIIGAVLGVALAVVLFMLLPWLIVKGASWLFDTEFSKLARTCIEQGVKLTLFVVYVWAVSFMKDIRRTFMYHGAEHKTIFCYEKGLELTVENVKVQTRLHPRCGTSFMILMILISVILSTVIQFIFPKVYGIGWLWVIVKILLVPLTCGIGFEVLKACGKYDNIITRIISAPGLWLQRITTKEPDEGMMEIAIAALKACEPQTPDVYRPCNEETNETEETE